MYIFQSAVFNREIYLIYVLLCQIAGKDSAGRLRLPEAGYSKYSINFFAAGLKGSCSLCTIISWRGGSSSASEI